MGFDTIAVNQSQPAVPANENLETLYPGALFAKRWKQTSGLTLGYYGGIMLVDGVLTTIASGTVALTASATNYVEATRAGVISANTSGFTAGRIPLYTAITGGSTIATLTDQRAWQAPANIGSLLAKTWPSDANYTLTAAEARARILVLSGGSLSATRNLVVPLYGEWIVKNGTSGAQSIQVIGASGTGITIANAKTALVYGDGTNINRATADA